jgi:uncharacterized protein
MRIAIIGTGIAGNGAAFALATGSPHEIVVYEKENRLGGHSATVDIDYDGEQVTVDTGFIVYNELNYPNFTRLLDHLEVETIESDMSFSVSHGGGAFEWSGQPSKVFNGLFAQRRNLVSPRHFRMIGDMWRFNKRASLDLHNGRLSGLTLRDYLDGYDYSERFRKDYLIPMGAAIWSMAEMSVLDFPAESFIAFFENHRLLHWNRPVWRTIRGGSREYVKRLTEPFCEAIRLSCPAVRIVRDEWGVSVEDAKGGIDRFDQVILACHSPQALALLSNPTPAETALLGALPYAANDVWLHGDPGLMPRRKAAWSSWNVLREQPDIQGQEGAVSVTYWMNLLQKLDIKKPIFVSLNPPRPPAPETVFGRFCYEHPQYSRAGLAAQQRLPYIQGQNRTWFCGAWTRYGFHEDGLASGLTVAEALDAVLPWTRQEQRLTGLAE